MFKYKAVARTLAAVVTLAVAAPGCNSYQEEIPLAKVPPPPAGFGENKAGKGAPKGASPTGGATTYQP